MPSTPIDGRSVFLVYTLFQIVLFFQRRWIALGPERESIEVSWTAPDSNILHLSPFHFEEILSVASRPGLELVQTRSIDCSFGIAYIVGMETGSVPCFIRPGGALSQNIQFFWISRSLEPSAPSKYLLLPDGNIEIIFNLGDPENVYDVRNGAHWGLFGGPQLVGARTDPLLIEQTGCKHKIGVRFFPGGLYPFLQIPLNEVSDTIADPGYLLKMECKEMEDRLFHAKSAGEVINILRQKMLSRFNPGLQKDKSVDVLVNHIRLSRGNVSMKKISHQMGVSPKLLRRKFAARVGLTPKQFSQIVRFQALVKETEKKGISSWTSVAFDYGFYDQSHFIKEFKCFSGMTPSLFFSKRIKVIA